MKVIVLAADSRAGHALARGLREHNWIVDFKSTPPAALEYLESSPYEVAVIDVDHSGVEMLEALRAVESAIPVLAIAGAHDPVRAVELLNAGADDFVGRPYYPDELEARLRALVRRTRGRIGEQLRIGGITIDQIRRIVYSKEQPLELTRTEYRILNHLAMRAGQAVSRAALIANVWSTDADLGSNSLDVHINHLRRKLGEAASQLRTVRGTGYRLG